MTVSSERWYNEQRLFVRNYPYVRLVAHVIAVAPL